MNVQKLKEASVSNGNEFIVDPVLAAVISRRMESITEQMSSALLRSSRSPILNEAHDFVTGLFDHNGRMLNQSENIPIIAFALNSSLVHVRKYFGDDIHPGDVIIHNDVFNGGNQMADVGVYKPVFFDKKLIGWVGNKGHVGDIGGATPGGYTPWATEVWQEALRIPPLKIYKKGEFQRDVWDMVFANIRFDVVAEDVRAEIGGCVVGERLLIELVQKYGLETFRRYSDYLIETTEKAIREEIAAIPDGEYIGEAYLQSDGVTPGKKYKIRVTVRVKGDEMFIDYTGTDAQAPSYTNAPYASTEAAVFLTLMMHMRPDLQRNAGRLIPIHLNIPSGCILNAKFPAATGFGNHLSCNNGAALIRALSQAIPKKTTAGWNWLLAMVFSGLDPRKNRPYVDISFFSLKGGGGATFGADGYDHIGLICCQGGVMAQDPEMHEIQDPHFLEYFEYAPDSAGAGEWKGGLGVKSKWQFNGKGTIVSIFGDGTEEHAFGLFGGNPGQPNSIKIIFPDGSSYQPQTKEVIQKNLAGACVEQIAGGGGGYGDPYRRPVEKVLEDVKNEIVSAEKAKQDYGVVIDPTNFTVDTEATERIRKSRELKHYPWENLRG